jgi:hypothetical protein
MASTVKMTEKSTTPRSVFSIVVAEIRRHDESSAILLGAECRDSVE